MLVRDLVRQSLLNIGVLADNEAATATQLSDAILSLNGMIDTWSSEKLFIYSITNETFNFIPGQQIYSFGPGGDFNSSRPTKIENIAARINPGQGASQLDIPMKMLNADEWYAILAKTSATSWPTKYWADMQFPNAMINFWPIPQQAVQALVFSWKPLAQFANADAAVSLPPGFQEAITYNLALRLAPTFSKTPSEMVMALAASSKMAIKIDQSKTNILRVDPALQSVNKAWNYLTGE